VNRERIFDLLVIGGGINGAGITRDAAGRGLSVLLCEQGDLACATSSASSKLIHGGLRYLEQYEFRLVREALAEREVLLRLAPHIVRPLRFVLPHDRGMRPAWMLRLGLFLYDHLGGRRTLPGTSSLDLAEAAEGRPLKPGFKRGFAYSDCWVEDSRLVVLNALDAAERGADIRVGTRCVGARREDGLWRVRLRDATTGTERTVGARVLVNAAGPWVGRVLEDVAGGLERPAPLRLVKGSHIVVPRLHEGHHAYILQNDDRRVVFAIPYEDRFTLIGTTDHAFDGDPADVAISEAETAYLCAAANRYFRRRIGPSDVIHAFSGVRPLYDDRAANPSAVTRDYVFDLTGAEGEPPLLTIYGGKITTYRRLAEHALEKLAAHLPRAGSPWTATAPLPGGDMEGGFEAFHQEFAAARPWMAASLARRLCRLYGTRALDIVGDAQDAADLGEHYGAGLHEAELRYLTEREWARSAGDVLWRRTRLGLHLTAGEAARLAARMASPEPRREPAPISPRLLATVQSAAGLP
jgi:glycerol-3-phosphate dehydrogenase